MKGVEFGQERDEREEGAGGRRERQGRERKGWDLKREKKKRKEKGEEKRKEKGEEKGKREGKNRKRGGLESHQRGKAKKGKERDVRIERGGWFCRSQKGRGVR
ncbi:MAG: hypothetical protein U0Z75_06585 [Deinococcaceae bacterium]